MRKIDKEKISGKAAKTISFDKCVLMRLEELARKNNSTVSNLVNTICRRKVMTDAEFYSELAKEYHLKFQEAIFMKERAQEIVVTQGLM